MYFIVAPGLLYKKNERGNVYLARPIMGDSHAIFIDMYTPSILTLQLQHFPKNTFLASNHIENEKNNVRATGHSIALFSKL